jgi:hypothetical protein
MQRFASRALLGAVICALSACQAPKPSLAKATEGASATYMELQIRLEELRAQMRPIIRQAAVLIPLDCELAAEGIEDTVTRATLLDIAANVGVYGVSRMNAPDPKVGLADLIVTTASVADAIATTAAAGPYPSMQMLVETFAELEADLQRLGDVWLAPEVLAQVKEGIAVAKRTGAQDTHDLLRVNQLLASHASLPRSLQIDSSFVRFDDGGLFEQGLGEIHGVGLAVREVADIAAIMPQSLEFRLRRALLLSAEEPVLAKARADLASIASDLHRLESLGHLDKLASLDKLDQLAKLDALDKLGLLASTLEKLDSLEKLDRLAELESLGPLDGLTALRELVEMRELIAGAIVVGLCAQGALIAWASRRR